MDMEFSAEALEVAKQHPDWVLMAPGKYCPLMRTLADQGFSTQRISDELNHRKILRGNYGGGSHEWNANIVSMCYRAYTKTALQSGKPAQLGGRLSDKYSRATRIFLREHPDYTAWSDRKLLNWLNEQRVKEYHAYECAELLNEMKVVPAFLRDDSPVEFTGKNLALFYRRRTGKSFSGRAPRSDRKKKPVKLHRRRRRKETVLPEALDAPKIREPKEAPKTTLPEAPVKPVEAPVKNDAYSVIVEGMKWLSPTRLRVQVVFEGELSDTASVNALNRILALAEQELQIKL